MNCGTFASPRLPDPITVSASLELSSLDGAKCDDDDDDDDDDDPGWERGVSTACLLAVLTMTWLPRDTFPSGASLADVCADCTISRPLASRAVRSCFCGNVLVAKGPSSPELTSDDAEIASS